VQGNTKGCQVGQNTPLPLPFRFIVLNARSPLWSSGQSSWLQNGDVVWFHWGTNWIYICYVEESRPPLVVRVPGNTWRGPEIQRSGYDSRRYQIFWEAVGLERCTLILESTIEELLGIKSSCSGLKNRECGRKDPPRRPSSTLYPQKLALTSLGQYSSLADSEHGV
jgi:hypothetical protein